MPHHLHLRIRTTESGDPLLLPFLREARPFYEAPGGIRVRLLRSLRDPRRYIEIVEYEDAAAFEQDDARVRSDPEMAAWLQRWRALLAEGPEVEVWEDLTALLDG